MKKTIFQYYGVYSMRDFKHICEKYTDQAQAVARAKEIRESRDYGYNARIVAYYTEMDTVTGEVRIISNNLYSRRTLRAWIEEEQQRVDNAIRNNFALATINLYHNLLKKYEQQYEEAIW